MIRNLSMTMRKSRNITSSYWAKSPLPLPAGAKPKRGIKLERFAVLPGFRNRGIGEIILKEVLKDVLQLEKPVYLHSQVKAVPFYHRNGFFTVGEEFTEAGIGHFFMEYPD